MYEVNNIYNNYSLFLYVMDVFVSKKKIYIYSKYIKQNYSRLNHIEQSLLFTSKKKKISIFYNLNPELKTLV